MKKYLFIFTVLLNLTCGTSHKQTKKEMTKEYKHTNKLINETSPYLLQHAHNPVNWYPWGDEALKKAKDENKLLLISIGYSACHWCHVMEHESFEDEAVAEIMNKYYVCIKVDREERPDIDQIYMNAVQLITGQGGWPLNCFAFADGRPVFGGTYFNKQQWTGLLENLHNTQQKDPERFETAAQQISQGIAGSELVEASNIDANANLDDLIKGVEFWKNSFDEHEGGNDKAPKFPMPTSWEYLFDYTFQTGDSSAQRQALLTLDKMAAGGIYDHAGGGFSRYSVDAYWKVPHFEKMLYDNSQLVSLYSKAYKVTKNERYKEVVYQSLEFIKRELTSGEDGFYSALDADSEGEEGKFYVWKQSELDEILGEKSAIFSDYYSAIAFGNWEYQKNILFRTKSKEKITKDHNITLAELKLLIKDGNSLIMKARESRIRPGLDDKILTSWNALMIKGYADAYGVFNDEDFLVQAEKSITFLQKNLQEKDYRLNRTYKNGKSKTNAFLDDYAHLISAQIALYQVTFNEKYLFDAQENTSYVIKHFFDKKSGMFYYVSDLDKDLIVRKKEVSDNVIPASNSVMAENLVYLGLYFHKTQFTKTAQQMCANITPNLEKNTAYFSKWATVSMMLAKPAYEVVITGEKSIEFYKELNSQFRPDMIFACAKTESKLPIFESRFNEGKTQVFVCKNNTCKAPVESTEDAKQLLVLPVYDN